MSYSARLALFALILVAGTSWPYPATTSRPALRVNVPTASSDVVASARLAPEGGVLDIGASVDLGTGVIDQLFVKEDDRVTAGQPMATLGSHKLAAARLLQAQAEMAVARARREQAVSGALTTDLATRDAEIDLRRAESAQAEIDLNRAVALHTLHDVATSTRDERRLAASRAQIALVRAERERATAIATRDDAIRLADAELAQAQASVDVAIAELEQATVRAPQSGTVLRILARPGERIGADGLLQLGETRRTYAVAEVFVGDLPMVQEHMPATVSGGPLAAPLEGVVERVALVAGPRRMDGIDGGSVRGERVAEVWIALETSNVRAYGSIVKATIHTGPGRTSPLTELGHVAWQPPSPR